MLQPIFKSEGVNDSERQMSKLLNDTFLSLWSYVGPCNDRNLSTKNEGVEICDAIVAFGNKIIIFSDKDNKFNENKDLNTSWKRWYKDSVKKSINQLHGAESWIRTNPHRVFLDKKCQNKFPFDLSSKNLEIHLVALTKNTLEPAKKYFNQFAEGSSGTFAHIYALDEKDVMENPFTLNDFNREKTFVHVFDEYSIDLVIKQTGTISDFLHYLTFKELFIRKYNLSGSLGEENFLAFYLSQEPSLLARNEFNFDELKQYTLSDDNAVFIGEDEWEVYQNSYNCTLRNILLKKSKYWEELITRFSDGIVTAQVGEGAELDLATHEIAVRALASENISIRALLSDAFKEKFINVPTNRRSARIIEPTPNKDLLYVFLLLPRDEKESIEEYVAKRNAYSQGYGLVAKYLYPKYTKVIVLSTQPLGSEGRSEGVYLFGYPKVLSHEEKKAAEKLRKEQHIFNGFTDYNDLGRNHDSPFKVKKGRNDKCHCGSDLKYKKCCLDSDELFGSNYT